jgi:hypothetical protein
MAFAGRAMPYVVLVTGTVRLMLGGDMDPGQSLETIQAYPLSTKGKPLSVVKLGALEANSASISLRENGVFADLSSAIAPIVGESYAATIDVTFGAAPVKKAAAPGARATLGPEYRVHLDAGYNHFGHTVRESNPGYTYKNFTLTTPAGRTIAIPKSVAFYLAKPNVIAAPDGKRALLIWNAVTLQCSPSDDIPGRYKMALVDTTAGTVVPLGEGEGAGFGEFDRDGVLYLQRDRRVTRLATDGKDDGNLPDGILLVPPVVNNPYCGF